MSQPSLLSPALSVPSEGGEGFDLLCACATSQPSQAQIARIANWDRTAVDWPDFLGLAEHHGVLPLAARNLGQHAVGIPLDVERSLQSAYHSNLRRSLWFAAELARILQHCKNKGLQVLPYKGPLLAQSAYGDLGLRSFFDLDFLISPYDFVRAKQVFSEIGYRPSQEIPAAIERLWLRTGYERSFDGAAGKNLLELQWNLLPHFYAVDFQSAVFRMEDLLARASRTQLGEDDGMMESPCLSPEDSLLALCLHAAKHLWARLIWVADIAESARRQSVDFATVVQRARLMGISRVVGVSFSLAEQLLRMPIPPAVRDAAKGDPDVTLLGQEFGVRLARGANYDFKSTEYFRKILKLRERGRDRLRYLWRLVWTPGPGDVAVMKLPEALFPLYHAVRIGRLLRKVV